MKLYYVPQSMVSLMLIPVRTECHCGYKADEYPKDFLLEGEKYEIAEITDRWYQVKSEPYRPAANYFKVLTTSKKLFLLKHDLDNDQWYVVSGEI